MDHDCFCMKTFLFVSHSFLACSVFPFLNGPINQINFCAETNHCAIIKACEY